MKPFQFSVRDICWFMLALCLMFGGYSLGMMRANEQVEQEIWDHGFYLSRQHSAVVFPLSNGKMVRFHTVPSWTSLTPGVREVEVRDKDGNYGGHFSLRISDGHD